MKEFKCKNCTKQYDSFKGLKIHSTKVHKFKIKTKFKCYYCNKKFTRKEKRNWHSKKCKTQEKLTYICFKCGEKFANKADLKNHLLKHINDDVDNFFTFKQAIESNIIIKRKILNKNQKTLDTIFNKQNKLELIQLVEYYKHYFDSIRFQIHLRIEMGKLDENSEINQIEEFSIVPPYAATNKLIKNNANLINNQITTLYLRIEDLETQGSNWVIVRGLYLDLNIVKTRELGGGNGGIDLKKIDLRFLGAKRYKQLKYFNQNTIDDNNCFLYNICYHLTKKKITDIRVFKEIILKYDFLKNIVTPVSFSDIPKIDILLNNKFKIKINIFGYNHHQKYTAPIYISKLKADSIINMLYIDIHKNVLYKTDSYRGFHFFKHYFYLEDISKYFRNANIREWWCSNCFTRFRYLKEKDDHEISCIKNNSPQVVVLPNKGKEVISKMNFAKVYQRYIGFVDFEASNTPYLCNSCKYSQCICIYRTIKNRKFDENKIIYEYNKKRFVNTKVNNTQILSTQNPICYSFVLLDSYTNKVIIDNTYLGENADEKFIDFINDITPYCNSILSKYKPLIITKEIQNFKLTATNCYLCKVIFTSNADKIYDHDHISGCLIGITCNKCNLNRRRQTNIDVFAHNFKNYDGHFILAGLSKSKTCDLNDVRILSSNTEKFLCLKYGSFTFKDSQLFLNGSLEKLTENLKDSKHNFPILKTIILKNEYNIKNVKQKYESLFELLTKKQIYPYEYITDINKMKEKKLPNKNNFFSSLKGENISDSQYKHAKHVYSIFNCKNIGDYTKLYCQLDTILLSEVFNSFRETMFTMLKLDPSYFVSLPSYAYNSMLNTLPVDKRIQLVDDKGNYCKNLYNMEYIYIYIYILTDFYIIITKDMHDMIKNGLRGGHR